MDKFPKAVPPIEESPLKKAFDPEFVKGEIERASKMIEEGEQILEEAEKLATTPELKRSIDRVRKSKNSLFHSVALAVSMFSAGSGITSGVYTGIERHRANQQREAAAHQHEAMIEDAIETRAELRRTSGEDIRIIAQQLREWRNQPGNERRPLLAMTRYLIENYRQENAPPAFYRDGNDPRGNLDMPMIQLESLVLEEAFPDWGPEQE